jgi:3-deoxy-D-manno-octulosonic-acid transferase
MVSPEGAILSFKLPDTLKRKKEERKVRSRDQAMYVCISTFEPDDRISLNLVQTLRHSSSL